MERTIRNDLLIQAKVEIAKTVQDLDGPASELWSRGIQSFLNEDFTQALAHFKAATSQSDNPDLQDLIALCENNIAAGIHQFVPPVTYFDKEDLLDPKQLKEDLPKPVEISLPYKLFDLSKNLIGRLSGTVMTWIFDEMTKQYGIWKGYRDQIWTNWYRRPLFQAILTLAYMRNRLTQNNLIGTYPEGKLVGFVDPEHCTPPPAAKQYRTANGSWNNLNDPMEGAAGTRFTRNIPAPSIQKELNNSLLEPNPRLLSRWFLTRKNGMVKAPFLNMLAVAWIQFQTHDWVSHGEPLGADYWRIPLAKDDPARKRFFQRELLVGKTQPDPTYRPGQENMPITFINEVTHWWDGSQIYGSDALTQSQLRSHQDGKMRLTADGNLPVNERGMEETGYVRNWWVGLTLFHTLFVKEHNAICDMLIRHYPGWTDDQYFQVARLINSALMAKIHTVEWNSSINPNLGIFNGNHTNWYGYLTTALRKKKNWKTVADINIRNTELGGVVGNPVEKNGVAHGLTQEFVEAYRLHSMLPETLLLRRIQQPYTKSVPIAQTRQSASHKWVEQEGIANLIFSFANQNPGQLVLNNYPAFMQNMSIPGNPVFDLGAVDILRSRERGVPRYNDFRRGLDLAPIHSFEDLTSNPHYLQMLKKAYGQDAEAVNRLDLMIGCLAEETRPTGFALGETQFQLFMLNATRRLQTDRFFTDCYAPEYYTPEGMAWIDSNNLKSVLLRHYPELAHTGLANIEHPFSPWDEGEDLDPKRHPIRAFDPATKDNPWKGNRRWMVNGIR